MIIKLGNKVKDSLTGFEGVAVARCEYLDGCVRYQVQPQQLHDGKIVEPEWFDVNRLTDKGKSPPGGPQSAPPSRDP